MSLSGYQLTIKNRRRRRRRARHTDKDGEDSTVDTGSEGEQAMVDEPLFDFSLFSQLSTRDLVLPS